MLWLVRDEASYVERWHHCIRPLMDIFLFIKNCFTLLKYSLSYELVNKLVCFEQFPYKHVPDILRQYKYFTDSLQFDNTSNQTAFCFSHSCFLTAAFPQPTVAFPKATAQPKAPYVWWTAFSPINHYICRGKDTCMHA